MRPSYFGHDEFAEYAPGLKSLADADVILVDGVSVGAVTSYTFTNVTANHTIAASFAINVQTISPEEAVEYARDVLELFATQGLRATAVRRRPSP